MNFPKKIQLFRDHLSTVRYDPKEKVLSYLIKSDSVASEMHRSCRSRGVFYYGLVQAILAEYERIEYLLAGRVLSPTETERFLTTLSGLDSYQIDYIDPVKLTQLYVATEAFRNRGEWGHWRRDK